MTLGMVYMPNLTGQHYKYFVFTHSPSVHLILEVTLHSLSKIMYSPVEVTALLKVGPYLVAGGNEGQTMVYNLNESEGYHRGKVKSRQAQEWLESVEWQSTQPPLRNMSFTSDYLQTQDDLLAEHSPPCQSRVLAIQSLHNN